MSIPKVLCAIPARYASQRLPGKPLADIRGLPLVLWVYRQALRARMFDRVVVATDDERIADRVRQAGGTALMTSRDHPSGTDRVFEALKQTDCTHVVNLQGDEPEVPPKLLASFAESLKQLDDKSLLTCVSNATIDEVHDPDTVKAVLSANKDALYFSRAPVPWPRDPGPYTAYRHNGLYGFTREGIGHFCGLPRGTLEQVEKLEQLRALEQGMRIHCLVYDYAGTGIDTPDDLTRFRRRVHHLPEQSLNEQ
jgi:3-deoxy-manno-octulosonate cytidylyltransferase (CMP-KDO synthetase)